MTTLSSACTTRTLTRSDRQPKSRELARRSRQLTHSHLLASVQILVRSHSQIIRDSRTFTPRSRLFQLLWRAIANHYYLDDASAILTTIIVIRLIAVVSHEYFYCFWQRARPSL